MIGKHILSYTCLDARNKKFPRLDLDLSLRLPFLKEYGEHPIVGATRVCSDYNDEHNNWCSFGYSPERVMPSEFGWHYSIGINPYLLTLTSSQNKLSVFGLYNDDTDLLVVTSIENLIDLIDNKWWHHRLSVDNFSISVPRLCSRWYRWKKDLALTSAQRFCILERNIKNASR